MRGLGAAGVVSEDSCKVALSPSKGTRNWSDLRLGSALLGRNRPLTSLCSLLLPRAIHTPFDSRYIRSDADDSRPGADRDASLVAFSPDEDGPPEVD